MTLLTISKQKTAQSLKDFFQADRFIVHLIIFALIVSIITLGSWQLSQQQLKPTHYGNSKVAPKVEPAPDTGTPLTLSGALKNRNTGLLLPVAVPHTIIPDRTVIVEEIKTYIVQPGDTIYGIADQFGLSPETIQWANPDLEDNPDFLSVGQELTILPLDGVYHQVGSGDTIAGIASAFKVKPEDIINYHLNELDPENPVIQPGQWLIVPGGSKPYKPKYVSVALANAPQNAQAGTGAFQWPANGTITQDFWSGHRALDIAAWIGAPIYAADSGYVTAAQWGNTGYGKMIIIDHGNGFKTLYAHLSALYVSVGDEVTQGQKIGEMGSTGNSTGPHLHFEIRLNGVQRNPWGFLP